MGSGSSWVKSFEPADRGIPLRHGNLGGGQGGSGTDRSGIIHHRRSPVMAPSTPLWMSVPVAPVGLAGLAASVKAEMIAA
jgi:hypothetical protein